MAASRRETRQRHTGPEQAYRVLMPLKPDQDTRLPLFPPPARLTEYASIARARGLRPGPRRPAWLHALGGILAARMQAYKRDMTP